MKQLTHNSQPITHNRKPLVSVIMPVYNAGEYLVEALDSVFAQTYQNIEVIAINDGSTDKSLQILRKYAKNETRLKAITYKRNKGVGAAANKGVAAAKGDYIARMDADDIIPPDRIKKQVKYLLENPNVVVVGGQVELINEYKSPIVAKRFPYIHKDIVNLAFETMPIQQGAMMVNKKLLPAEFVWYRTKLETSEDLDFFFRIFKYGQGANVKDTVLFYRQHGKSITQAQNPKKIFFQACKVRLLAIFDYGIVPSPSTLLFSFLQFILVLVMPSFLIYPIYYIWRGMKPSKVPKKNYWPLLKHALTYLF